MVTLLTISVLLAECETKLSSVRQHQRQRLLPPSSLAPRSHHKLCFKYFGPFKIIEKIGFVAYKLQLSPSSSIHPIFHVSLLKPMPASSFTASSKLPEPSEALQVLERVLQ